MEKDFAWLCSSLSMNGAKVPVPETVFLWKEDVVLWVQSIPSGELRRCSNFEEPLSSPGEVLRYFAAQREKEPCPGAFICTANVKGVRIGVTEDRIDEAKSLRGVFSRCSYFQRAVEDKTILPIYVLSVDLQGNQYSSDFRVQRNSSRECRDLRLYFKLLTYVKIALRTVEVVRRRRVAQMGLEFFVGRDGATWLLGCSHLRLLPSTEDTKKAEDTPKTDAEIKWKMLPELERKPRTKKFPTLRISTPQQFAAQPEETEVPVSRTESHMSQQSRPSVYQSPSPTLPRQSRHSGIRRNYSFNNPQFKELLAINYAKSKNWLYSDIDSVYMDFEQKVLQEDEPVKKRSDSILKRSLSGPILATAESIELFAPKETLKKEVTTEATVETKPTARAAPASPLAKRKPPRPSNTSSLDKILALYSAGTWQQCSPPFHRKNHSLPSLHMPKTFRFARLRT